MPTHLISLHILRDINMLHFLIAKCSKLWYFAKFFFQTLLVWQLFFKDYSLFFLKKIIVNNLALRSKPKIKVIEEEILIIAQLLVFFFLLWCSGSFNKIIKGWLDNNIQGSSIMYSIYFLLILRGKKTKRDDFFVCTRRKNIVESHNVFFLFSLFFSAT